MDTIAKAGRYEILGELGRGAMGVVYRATDPVIGRPVAVKSIRLSEEGTGLTRNELLSRFQTEARAAGLLTHPNIVVVYDAGEENSVYYITMELVEGKSLQSLLDGGHAFPVPRVLRILEQACSALAFAHERNVVHRDIKPANLMLTADDTVKVTDFGTAKILQFGTVQQTTHVMGTPSYMSPEQVKGRPVDGRSDIFSLGVVLYEMLTGEKPFPGQSITTVIYKIVNEDPVPPRQLNPSIHPGLNEIVLKALAKEPEVRYQTCREMLEDLKSYRNLVVTDRGPDATLISPRTGPAGQPFATPTSPLRPYVDDPATAAAAHALQNRASSPMQTPTVRRTGPVQPYQEPPKKPGTFATMLAAIFLLCVIVWGGIKLRPEWEAARQLNQAAQAQSQAPAAVPPATAVAPTPPQPLFSGEKDSPAERPSATSASPPAAPEGSEPTETAAADAPTKAAPEAPAAPVSVTKKREPTLSPAAAAYKSRIEEALDENGLKGRVKVTGTGSTLTLGGKLRPAEHASLLKFMRNAPSKVHVVDDILYDDTPVPAAETGDHGAQPVPEAGTGAVQIVTDVLGANATLFGSAGRELSTCTTPCTFNNLLPERYSLQIRKDGYSTVQTALELKSGQTLDQKFRLEAVAKGLYVTSRPAGADIFINGAKQSGQTPAMLPLAPGQYDLVLRFPGYEAYAGHIQVKDNVRTTLEAELKEKIAGRVAWAQVNSTPEGAEIFIDGAPTGQVSPARVQIPAGSHIIALRLNGYQVAKRGVQASEGGTVNVTETLKQR
jgi:eukaryotic-like serine/threonine-protein kinase